MNYRKLCVFALLVLGARCFAAPGIASMPENYPNFHDNALLTHSMRLRIAPHLMPLDHPIKAALDCIFSQSRAVESEQALVDAGFEIMVPAQANSYVIVARHVGLPGYVFKLHLDSEIRSRKKCPHWIWLTHRCTEAKKIRSVIEQRNIRHFLVPDKWLFVLPAHPYSSSPHPQVIILVETDMQLVSGKETKEMWKSGIQQEHLDELYSILKHGYGGRSTVHLTSNVPFTKHGKFAFIDTEGPQLLDVDLKDVKKHLSKEMQDYWDALIR